MYTLSTAQDARDLVMLAEVAERLLAKTDGLTPERYLEFRMNSDCDYEMEVIKVQQVALNVNEARAVLVIKFLFVGADKQSAETGYYNIWVAGDSGLTGA